MARDAGLELHSSKGLSYASCGAGTPQHLAGGTLEVMASVKLVHVPYKGCAPAMTDVISGQAELGINTLANSVPMVAAKKLRPLAVSSAQRNPLYPDVPTVAESGYKGFEAVTWFGVLGPAKLPAAVVSTVNAELNKALNSPDLRKKLEDQGLNVTPSSSDEFAKLIKADITKWAQVVKDSGAKAD